MRLDPKYFPHFMGVLAVTGILAIALGSLRYPERQKQRFLDRLEKADPEWWVFLDERGEFVQPVPDRPTVILFWASWSERSKERFRDLYQWHKHEQAYRVIAAYVKDSREIALLEAGSESDFFQILDGTGPYQDLRVPGVPTAVILSASGHVYAVEIGNTGQEAIWHKLSAGSNP